VIVADTNVLSETLRQRPDPAVMAWLAANENSIALTSITAGELLCGAYRLPRGRRRTRLVAQIDRLVTTAGNRILAYDLAAARICGRLRADTTAEGRPRPEIDIMVAAIATVNDAAVATRNTRDFRGLGIEVIDPWMHDG
jgi:predicted nucleic acid-binding protein